MLDVTLETLQTVLSNIKAEYKAATLQGYITEWTSFSFWQQNCQDSAYFKKLLESLESEEKQRYLQEHWWFFHFITLAYESHFPGIPSNDDMWETCIFLEEL